MESLSITDAASAGKSSPKLRSEFLFQIIAGLSDPLNVGETPLGFRRILYMEGGSFPGFDLKGLVLPGGGDWVLTRRDGVAQLDIRMALRTHDNELIYVTCRGVFDIASELRARISQGETVDATQYYFRTALMFETAAEKYEWLNRLVAVGMGMRTPTGMVTDVFAIK